MRRGSSRAVGRDVAFANQSNASPRGDSWSQTSVRHTGLEEATRAGSFSLPPRTAEHLSLKMTARGGIVSHNAAIPTQNGKKDAGRGTRAENGPDDHCKRLGAFGGNLAAPIFISANASSLASLWKWQCSPLHVSVRAQEFLSERQECRANPLCGFRLQLDRYCMSSTNLG
jgi:hypothetical protein